MYCISSSIPKLTKCPFREQTRFMAHSAAHLRGPIKIIQSAFKTPKFHWKHLRHKTALMGCTVHWRANSISFQSICAIRPHVAWRLWHPVVLLPTGYVPGLFPSSDVVKTAFTKSDHDGTKTKSRPRLRPNNVFESRGQYVLHDLQNKSIIFGAHNHNNHNNNDIWGT